MVFEDLVLRLSVKLRRIARKYSAKGSVGIEEDDLYQEMCMRLWEKFKDGVPEQFNDCYLIKGCEFHILNYLRKTREKVRSVSLDEVIDEHGTKLYDIIPDEKSLDKVVDNNITVYDVLNNGFTKKEKEVFGLLLKGLTVREAGARLGVSHVAIVKTKNRLIKKWQKKDRLPKS